MKASAKIKEFIKEQEQPGGVPAYEAYLCPAGVWTVGWGHTGPDVTEHTTVTDEQAALLFDEDLGKFEQQLDQWALENEVTLSQNQFDALVSFTYNVGFTAFKNSTLAQKLIQGDYEDAAGQFARWNKSNGQTLKGLTKRREAERQIFEGAA